MDHGGTGFPRQAILSSPLVEHEMLVVMDLGVPSWWRGHGGAIYLVGLIAPLSLSSS